MSAVPPSRDSAVGLDYDNTKHGPLPTFLDKGIEKHVLVSTLSGAQNALEYFNANIRPVLDSNPATKDYQVTLTESNQTVIDYTKSTIFPHAQAGRPQTIILLSGDGGIIDIVDTIHQCLSTQPSTSTFTNPTIALLPMGTGNALATSTSLVPASLALHKLFSTGAPRPLPTFRVRFSPGAQLITDEGRHHEPIAKSIVHAAVVASWGLHASLVATSDTVEYRKHGAERFKMAAQELMREGHVYQGKVSVRSDVHGEWRALQHGTGDASTSPGAEKEKRRSSLSKIFSRSSTSSNREKKHHPNEHSYILSTLVSNLESSFTISPAALPLSCNLRLIAIPAVSAEELTRILTLAYDGGKHVDDADVTYEEIEGLRIEFEEAEERWRVVCVDGRIVGVEEGGWVEVEMRKEEGRCVNLVC